MTKELKTPRKKILYLKKLVNDLQAHRKNYVDGVKKDACDDERTFCGWEKEQIISIIRAIVIDLKEIGEAINLKDSMEKEIEEEK